MFVGIARSLLKIVWISVLPGSAAIFSPSQTPARPKGAAKGQSAARKAGLPRRPAQSPVSRGVGDLSPSGPMSGWQAWSPVDRSRVYHGRTNPRSASQGPIRSQSLATARRLAQTSLGEFAGATSQKAWAVSQGTWAWNPVRRGMAQAEGCQGQQASPHQTLNTAVSTPS